MDKVKEILKRKPTTFLLLSVLYLFLVALIKWWVSPTISTLFFLAGGAIGLYFLDIAEVIFSVHPSPFRTIVFVTLFAIVSFFVVTSSGSMLAIGMVLSIFLTILLWQVGEWTLMKNINSWYRMLADPVSQSTQRIILVLSFLVFVIETMIFIHW
jgi:hypothetical protein